MKNPPVGIPEGMFELFAAVEHFRRRDDLERFDRIMEPINEMFPEFNPSQAYTLRELLIMQAEWTSKKGR